MRTHRTSFAPVFLGLLLACDRMDLPPTPTPVEAASAPAPDAPRETAPPADPTAAVVETPPADLATIPNITPVPGSDVPKTTPSANPTLPAETAGQSPEVPPTIPLEPAPAPRGPTTYALDPGSSWIFAVLKYDLDALIAGHDHVMERSGGADEAGTRRDDRNSHHAGCCHHAGFHHRLQLRRHAVE